LATQNIQNSFPPCVHPPPESKDLWKMAETCSFSERLLIIRPHMTGFLFPCPTIMNATRERFSFRKEAIQKQSSRITTLIGLNVTVVSRTMTETQRDGLEIMQ
jgi:hypothetical protein